MNKTLILVLFIGNCAFADKVERIKSISFDKSKVEKIYVASGLTTLVSFNCDINEMISGNEEQVTLKPLITNKRQMIITLSKDAAQPTNIFVRCGQKTDPFVFDIVPSKKNHQDYIKINMAFGEPTEELQKQEPLNKVSNIKKKRVVIDVKPPEPIKDEITKLKEKKRPTTIEIKRDKIEDLINENEAKK